MLLSGNGEKKRAARKLKERKKWLEPVSRAVDGAFAKSQLRDSLDSGAAAGTQDRATKLVTMRRDRSALALDRVPVADDEEAFLESLKELREAANRVLMEEEQAASSGAASQWAPQRSYTLAHAWAWRMNTQLLADIVVSAAVEVEQAQDERVQLALSAFSATAPSAKKLAVSSRGGPELQSVTGFQGGPGNAVLRRALLRVWQTQTKQLVGAPSEERTGLTYLRVTRRAWWRQRFPVVAPAEREFLVAARGLSTSSESSRSSDAFFVQNVLGTESDAVLLALRLFRSSVKESRAGGRQEVTQIGEVLLRSVETQAVTSFLEEAARTVGQSFKSEPDPGLALFWPVFHHTTRLSLLLHGTALNKEVALKAIRELEGFVLKTTSPSLNETVAFATNPTGKLSSLLFDMKESAVDELKFRWTEAACLARDRNGQTRSDALQSQVDDLRAAGGTVDEGGGNLVGVYKQGLLPKWLLLARRAWEMAKFPLSDAPDESLRRRARIWLAECLAWFAHCVGLTLWWMQEREYSAQKVAPDPSGGPGAVVVSRENEPRRGVLPLWLFAPDRCSQSTALLSMVAVLENLNTSCFARRVRQFEEHFDDEWSTRSTEFADEHPPAEEAAAKMPLYPFFSGIDPVSAPASNAADTSLCAASLATNPTGTFYEALFASVRTNVYEPMLMDFARWNVVGKTAAFSRPPLPRAAVAPGSTGGQNTAATEGGEDGCDALRLFRKASELATALLPTRLSPLFNFSMRGARRTPSFARDWVAWVDKQNANMSQYGAYKPLPNGGATGYSVAQNAPSRLFAVPEYADGALKRGLLDWETTPSPMAADSWVWRAAALWNWNAPPADHCFFCPSLDATFSGLLDPNDLAGRFLADVAREELLVRTPPKDLNPYAVWANWYACTAAFARLRYYAATVYRYAFQTDSAADRLPGFMTRFFNRIETASALLARAGNCDAALVSYDSLVVKTKRVAQLVFAYSSSSEHSADDQRKVAFFTGSSLGSVQAVWWDMVGRVTQLAGQADNRGLALSALVFTDQSAAARRALPQKGQLRVVRYLKALFGEQGATQRNELDGPWLHPLLANVADLPEHLKDLQTTATAVPSGGALRNEAALAASLSSSASAYLSSILSQPGNYSGKATLALKQMSNAFSLYLQGSANDALRYAVGALQSAAGDVVAVSMMTKGVFLTRANDPDVFPSFWLSPVDLLVSGAPSALKAKPLVLWLLREIFYKQTGAGDVRNAVFDRFSSVCAGLRNLRASYETEAACNGVWLPQGCSAAALDVSAQCFERGFLDNRLPAYAAQLRDVSKYSEIDFNAFLNALLLNAPSASSEKHNPQCSVLFEPILRVVAQEMLQINRCRTSAPQGATQGTAQGAVQARLLPCSALLDCMGCSAHQIGEVSGLPLAPFSVPQMARVILFGNVDLRPVVQASLQEMDNNGTLADTVSLVGLFSQADVQMRVAASSFAGLPDIEREKLKNLPDLLSYYMEKGVAVGLGQWKTGSEWNFVFSLTDSTGIILNNEAQEALRQAVYDTVALPFTDNILNTVQRIKNSANAVTNDADYTAYAASNQDVKMAIDEIVANFTTFTDSSFTVNSTPEQLKTALPNYMTDEVMLYLNNQTARMVLSLKQGALSLKSPGLFVLNLHFRVTGAEQTFLNELNTRVKSKLQSTIGKVEDLVNRASVDKANSNTTPLSGRFDTDEAQKDLERLKVLFGDSSQTPRSKLKNDIIKPLFEAFFANQNVIYFLSFVRWITWATVYNNYYLWTTKRVSQLAASTNQPITWENQLASSLTLHITSVFSVLFLADTTGNGAQRYRVYPVGNALTLRGQRAAADPDAVVFGLDASLNTTQFQDAQASFEALALEVGQRLKTKGVSDKLQREKWLEALRLDAKAVSCDTPFLSKAHPLSDVFAKLFLDFPYSLLYDMVYAAPPQSSGPFAPGVVYPRLATGAGDSSRETVFDSAWRFHVFALDTAFYSMGEYWNQIYNVKNMLRDASSAPRRELGENWSRVSVYSFLFDVVAGAEPALRAVVDPGDAVPPQTPADSWWNRPVSLTRALLHILCVSFAVVGGVVYTDSAKYTKVRLMNSFLRGYVTALQDSPLQQDELFTLDDGADLELQQHPYRPAALPFIGTVWTRKTMEATAQPQSANVPQKLEDVAAQDNPEIEQLFGWMSACKTACDLHYGLSYETTYTGGGTNPDLCFAQGIDADFRFFRLLGGFAVRFQAMEDAMDVGGTATLSQKVWISTLKNLVLNALVSFLKNPVTFVSILDYFKNQPNVERFLAGSSGTPATDSGYAAYGAALRTVSQMIVQSVQP